MAGVAGGIQSGERAGALDDAGDRVGVQPAGSQVAVAVDLAPERALGDPRQGQPGAERAHRAGVRMGAVGDGDHGADGLLVGLAPAQGELEAVLGLDDIGDVEGEELGAAEAAINGDCCPQTATRRASSAVTSGAFCVCAVPRGRRMPCIEVVTTPERVGLLCS